MSEGADRKMSDGQPYPVELLKNETKIGRIVHYVSAVNEAPGQVERPAMIVRVCSPSDTTAGCVNLIVFNDGPSAWGIYMVTAVDYDRSKVEQTWHFPED
jgi:hypothetical protein